MEIDINTLMVNGIGLPLILVFLTQWFKEASAMKLYRILLPFIIGFTFSIFMFSSLTETIFYGFVFGAIATGEYKVLKMLKK